MAATEGPRVAASRRRSFTPRYPAWLTLPSMLYYAFFFLGPMAILAVFSVAKPGDTFGSVVYTVDWSQFASLWDPVYIKIFWHTLAMAAGGTLLTILVGYPIAYWISRYLTSYKTLALLLIVVPFWTSFLIRTYAWLIILDPQGYLARLVNSTGLTHNWNILFSGKAVGIGLVYNYLPLLILPVYASLERMDWTLVESATDLGATPLKAFRDVTLRLTLPGLVTGALLVFIPMTGEYVIPALLGGGNFVFVGTVIGDQFLGAVDWPFGAAMSLALIGVVAAFVAVYLVFATKEEQFGA
ncbi:MAG: ABC transporter permease [Actinobacteria bacterium]|nr:MAG: ABC transporter permease [Actinomycetota bacterium]